VHPCRTPEIRVENEIPVTAPRSHGVAGVPGLVRQGCRNTHRYYSFGNLSAGFNVFALVGQKRRNVPVSPLKLARFACVAILPANGPSVAR
jgi:hypothetical protein